MRTSSSSPWKASDRVAEGHTDVCGAHQNCATLIGLLSQFLISNRARLARVEMILPFFMTSVLGTMLKD